MDFKMHKVAIQIPPKSIVMIIRIHDIRPGAYLLIVKLWGKQQSCLPKLFS